MHGILPSEIARLVLDYLEASSCTEAARVFLETSPDLQECRRVAANGGRFITRVFGLTLINILHTFCDIYGLVQERLSRIDDGEQLRRCGDLCEQLRTLIDGCRGQRFFVNINVPAQPQNQMTTGGSPIITSSIRRRRHSGPANRDKINRPLKSQSLPDNENVEPTASSQWNDVNIQSLPVNQMLNANPTTDFKEPQSSSGLLSDEMTVQCSSTVGESVNGVQSSQDDNNKKELSEKGDGSCGEMQNCHRPLTNENLAPKKLSTGTDTQELMKYSTAEVQTTPYDIIESESEMTDEPVENLSLFTKELLNRTELQERIADNINKAILPTDGLSLNDLSFSKCIASSECNTSIMTELNNAIKSIVTATQTDPVFEKFFDEIFQHNVDGEQSLDDETRRNNVHSNGSPSDESPRTADEFINKSESDEGNKMAIEMSPNDKTSQLSVESQINQVNTELSLITTPMITTVATAVTENQALEDFNAAAVQSIINANHKLSEASAMETETSSDKQLNCPQYNFPTTKTTVVAQPSVSEPNFAQNHQQIQSEANIIPNVEIISHKNPSPIPKKLTRKPKVNKQRQKSTSNASRQLISTETMVPVPTLIVCNNNDINITSSALPIRLFNNIDGATNNIIGTQKSQFIPIAPKDSSGSAPSTLYIRTVNVPKKVSVLNSTKKQTDQQIQNPITIIEKSNEAKTMTTEAITLYGTNENNLGEILEPSSLPAINVEESTAFSGSDLSPFLKFNKKVPQCSNADESTEKNNANENITAPAADCDITKRTPRSLLKSRSLNHRLSLSTPRRKSGHIRALDFNTPPKEINTSRRLSEADACLHQSQSSDSSKPVCRTSLFKSPPFENSPHDKQKTLRVSRPTKAPSADSSPTPTLHGGWDKISGVGTILGCSSSTVSTTIQPLSSSSKNDATTDVIIQQRQYQMKPMKSWDADLRQSLDIHDDERKPQGKLRKRNVKVSANENETAVPVMKKSGSVKKFQVSSQNKLSPIIESNSSICNIKVLKTNVITETVAVDKKGVTKKYAKLKTLATNIKRINSNSQINLSNINISSELNDKSTESVKIQPHNLSNIMMELETPRKNEITMGVPPTPRVISPNNATPFIRTTENLGRVRCFIATPDFPPTPSINLTPGQTSQNTTDVANSEFSAPYYQPSSKIKETPNVQLQNEHNDIKGNKLEITQFEVIKENLPKDEACKEFNISINSKDTDGSKSGINTAIDKHDNFDNSKAATSLENSGTTLSDSSDSESNTSSSSSCSSSSCSCNDDTTNNSSRMSTSRRSKDTSKKNDTQSSVTDLTRKIIDKGDENLDDSCDEIERQIARVIPLDNAPCDEEKIIHDKNPMWKKNELSPEKVFPIIKTQEALDDANTETPAKDETLLCEAEISETPSGPNSGIENLTNLSSKISALIVANEPNPRKYHGALRKMDAKLSVDSVKSNILTSLNLHDDDKSNKIIEQDEREKLHEKSGKTKFTGLREIECSLKSRLKSASQQIEKLNSDNTSRKPKNDNKINIKENLLIEKNKKDKKTIDEECKIIKENVKNNSTDPIESMTNFPDKLSIDDVTGQVPVKLNSPNKTKSLTNASTLNSQNLSAHNNDLGINSCGTSKSELSVLESLKLVPASKAEIVEDPEMNESKSSHHCHREFNFIHDDAIITKRRNIKKYNSSDLEFAVQLRNDEFATLSATRFDILFTLPSKNVRARQTRKTKPQAKSEVKPAKPTIRSIKIVKGVTIAMSNKLSPISSGCSQPLATSSPVLTEAVSKTTIGKLKLTSDNTDDINIKVKNSKQETRKQSMTTRKRKERSVSRDDEPIEKKSTVTNPKLLLSRVNIDEFLTTVHGPVTKS